MQKTHFPETAAY